MKPVEISKPMNIDDMIDITDKINITAYIHTDPNNGEKDIIVRLRQEGKFDIGIDVGLLSEKILEHI